MKKIFLPLMLIIFLLTGCGNCPDEKCKLVIGIDDEFAPISFHNEKNELVGFEIDLAKETCERMGVKAEFKPINWSSKREEIYSGEIDMIWNGLDITEERKEYMIFSKPYMEDRQVVLVRNNSDLNITSEYDLEGKIIGTQAGSISDDYFNENNELRNSFSEYNTYDKFGDVIEALKNSEIEICICDELVARYEINIHPNQLKILNAKIGIIYNTGIGFPKDKVELRSKVQEAFDSMVADGTAQKISIKWFNADLIKYKK